MKRRPWGKKDANHNDVLEHWRDQGVSVLDLSAMGSGCPDALIMVAGPHGFAYSLVEIKDGSKPPSARKLTPDQVAFHTRWPDAIPVVTSCEDADRLVAAMRNGLSYV
jgi:hypothetical protein